MISSVTAGTSCSRGDGGGQGVIERLGGQLSSAGRAARCQGRAAAGAGGMHAAWRGVQLRQGRAAWRGMGAPACPGRRCASPAAARAGPGAACAACGRRTKRLHQRTIAGRKGASWAGDEAGRADPGGRGGGHSAGGRQAAPRTAASSANPVTPEFGCKPRMHGSVVCPQSQGQPGKLAARARVLCGGTCAVHAAPAAAGAPPRACTSSCAAGGVHSCWKRCRSPTSAAAGVPAAEQFTTNGGRVSDTLAGNSKGGDALQARCQLRALW